MKKILILINHFQIQDGVTRTAIGLANELARQDDVEVTLQSIFKFDPKMRDWLNQRVEAKPFLGFYFRGLPRLVELIPSKMLYRFLAKDKYDVEIGFGKKLPIQAIAASSNEQAKHYAWIHDYDVGLKLLPCYKKVDKVLTVSKCHENRFRQETNGTIPVQCCHNIIDEKKVCTMGEDKIPMTRTKETTFVAVGRLEQGKGILRLIECCGRLKQEGYRFQLWLIGDGEQRTILEQRTEELKLGDIVHFLGSQRNPHAYTSKADVLVCASYSEGYSTVCVEAIQLGVPVLSTNVSGAEEIVEDACAGMVVGMEDEALYAGMKSILDDPDQIRRWKEILQTTKKTFSYENRAKELAQVLEI